MKYHRSIYLLLCGILLLASSCHTTHTAINRGQRVNGYSDSNRAVIDTLPYILSRDSSHHLAYTTFATHISIDYSDQSLRQHFTASVRMYRDSLCWVSLQGLFGIEGVRLLITRDSVHIINRLRQEYASLPNSQLSTQLPLPANLQMVQRFLLGYLLIGQVEGLAYHGGEDSLLLCRADRPQYRYDAWCYPADYTWARYLWKDLLVRREMDVTFEQYSPVAGSPFAIARTVTIRQGTHDISLHLEYSKIRIDEPLEYPFDIPRDMTRVNEIHF